MSDDFDPEKVEQYPTRLSPGTTGDSFVCGSNSYNQIPGCSFGYGSTLDRYFHPPNGTPRPKQER